MNVKATVARQYQAIVNNAATSASRQLYPPAEGWIATTRKALGMSAADLARRLGLTRARISQAEQSELLGGTTLKTMQATAQAMGCRFVYAILPIEGSVEDLIALQARKQAQALVTRASTHMALESQSLSDDRNRTEVERIASELRQRMPANFWTDK